MGKSALVCGAGGFIGGHLVRRLKQDGFWVRGVDLKFNEYAETEADDFVIGDLRDQAFSRSIIDRPFNEVYQLAADMGGAGYIFTGEHDADVMHNSATINLNVLDACYKRRIERIFYSSSACMYPAYNQEDPSNPLCAEGSAYPAAPDSEYGWEKLFSERLYLAYRRNYGLKTYVGRFHNIFGPFGTWTGGKEKAPAAICRKVAMAKSGSEIEVWGDGEQTRSFLYIDECVEGTTRLLRSDFSGPVNIGSEEMVSINRLVDLVADIAGKRIMKRHIPGPQGVRGRNSDNTLISERLKWSPSQPLRAGLEMTYAWIEGQVHRNSVGQAAWTSSEPGLNMPAAAMLRRDRGHGETSVADRGRLDGPA
jgi:GDP-D-mannose 3', 5'-epimerase